MVVDDLRAQYGGAYSVIKKQVGTELRIYHRWDATGSIAHRVLSDILPHIREKEEQTRLSLAFNEHLTAFRGLRHQKGKMGIQQTIDDVEFSYRQSIKDRVSLLNHCHKPRAAATTE